jgi:hypothetical protein
MLKILAKLLPLIIHEVADFLVKKVKERNNKKSI